MRSVDRGIFFELRTNKLIRAEAGQPTLNKQDPRLLQKIPRVQRSFRSKLRYSIILRGIFNQPASLNFGDVANKGLFSRFEDFVEYDPVGFAVLSRNVRVSKIY
jgi:hypothetical protein